jgi:hypothetical protein
MLILNLELCVLKQQPTSLTMSRANDHAEPKPAAPPAASSFVRDVAPSWADACSHGSKRGSCASGEIFLDIVNLRR